MWRLVAAGIVALACGLPGPPAAASPRSPVETPRVTARGGDASQQSAVDRRVVAARPRVTPGGASWWVPTSDAPGSPSGSLGRASAIWEAGDTIAPMRGVEGFAVVAEDPSVVDAGAEEPPSGEPEGEASADPSIVDSAVFESIRERSTRLARCEPTIAIEDGHLNLVSGRTNVLHLTGTQLDSLGKVIFDSPPTAGTPLLINVDTPAAFELRGPSFAGIEPEHARHILFHFPYAARLRHVEGQVRGTIYAPHADMTDADPASIEGAVVVRALETSTQKRKVNPFSGTLRCEPPPTPEESADAPGVDPEPPARVVDRAVGRSLLSEPVAWFGLALSLLGAMILLALLGTRRRAGRSHK